MKRHSASSTPAIAAALFCAVAWAAYIAVYGWGAASDGDTISYRNFLVVRSLGYPMVLWLVDHCGLARGFGALQLALLFAGFFVLWRAAYIGLGAAWAWILLVLCLANVELAKYAFRQAPEALFAAALSWHLAALLSILTGSRDRVAGLILSGAAVFLLRPAGLPILIATAFSVAAYARPAMTIRFVAGVLVLGWIAPTVANGVTRGFYAPQIYGGFHTIMPVTNALLTAPTGEMLPEPLNRWSQRLEQLKGVYGEPSWPFEQSMLQAIASPYVTQALMPEFGGVEGQTINGLRAANVRGREAMEVILRAFPLEYLKGVAANSIGLLAVPGMLDAETKAGLLRRLSSPSVTEPLLQTEFRSALDAQRTIPGSLLWVLRVLGIAVVAVAIYNGVRLALHLFARIGGRRRPENVVALTCAWATMITGYIAMVGMVAAIPRFTLAIYPLLAVFLVTVAAAAAAARRQAALA